MYMRTHKISGKQLRFRLSQELDGLLERAREARTGRTAKTLVKEGPLRITMVALRKGTHMTKHHVDGQVSIQVLRGRLTTWTEPGAMDLSASDVLVLNDGVEYAVSARTDCAFLITMSWHGGVKSLAKSASTITIFAAALCTGTSSANSSSNT
jgi:quercetin dioxygenase-like cupin family protein